MNKKSKLITALVVLFLTGVITGIMGTRISYRNMLDKALEGTPILSERVEANLGKLTLPLEQDQKIAQILKEFREQTQNLREEFRPRLLTILTDTRQRILAELTPEQQGEFRKIVRDDLPLLQLMIEDR